MDFVCGNNVDPERISEDITSTNPANEIELLLMLTRLCSLLPFQRALCLIILPTRRANPLIISQNCFAPLLGAWSCQQQQHSKLFVALRGSFSGRDVIAIQTSHIIKGAASAHRGTTLL